MKPKQLLTIEQADAVLRLGGEINCLLEKTSKRIIRSSNGSVTAYTLRGKSKTRAYASLSDMLLRMRGKGKPEYHTFTIRVTKSK